MVVVDLFCERAGVRLDRRMELAARARIVGDRQFAAHRAVTGMNAIDHSHAASKAPSHTPSASSSAETTTA
jgi:hypothetical protein